MVDGDDPRKFNKIEKPKTITIAIATSIENRFIALEAIHLRNRYPVVLLTTSTRQCQVADLIGLDTARDASVRFSGLDGRGNE